MRPEDTPRSESSPLQQTPAPAEPAALPVSDADSETDTRPALAGKPISSESPEANVGGYQSTVPAPDAGAPVAASSLPGATRKKLWIGLGAALVLALATGYGAYAFWWNTPDKVVDDALAALVAAKEASTKGTADVRTGSGYSLKLTFDGASKNLRSSLNLGSVLTYQGTTVDPGLSLVADKDNLYIRLSNLKKSVSKIAGGQAEVLSFVDPLLSKIDSRWVVITPDDIKRLSGNNSTDARKEFDCVQSTLGSISISRVYQNELRDTYQKNRFITVKESRGVETVEGRPSNHYLLGLDENKAISFGKQLVNTTLFKAVDDCVSSDLKKQFLDENKKSAGTTTTTSTEVWIDTWSHQLRKIKLVSKDNDSNTSTLESSFQFNGIKTINPPKADTTIKDIESEINKLQQQVASPDPSVRSL